MIGNIFQWCEDYWHNNYDNAPINCNPWNSKSSFNEKVIRGGDCKEYSREFFYKFLSSARSYEHSLTKNSFKKIGFRIVLADFLD
jgi:formylglycine-generating enzyme required for sulfatase activity